MTSYNQKRNPFIVMMLHPDSHEEHVEERHVDEQRRQFMTNSCRRARASVLNSSLSTVHAEEHVEEYKTVHSVPFNIAKMRHRDHLCISFML